VSLGTACFVTTADWFFLSHRRSLGLALQRVGFDVVVAAEATGVQRDIERLGMRFVPLPLDRRSMDPLREARAFAAIFSLYRRERPLLVHHSSIKPTLYGALAARALGLPAFVNTLSGLGYLLTERPTDGLSTRALRAVAALGYRVALRGGACWNVFQNPDQLQRFVGDGLADPSRSTLVRGSGVDTSRFRPTPLPAGPPVVLLPARMLWDKGIGEFVAAARRLRSRGSTARFVLAGGEDRGNRAAIPRATLEEWVSEGVVEWWGHQNDMPATFASAHLVVLPSYAEGLPLALAEAAASGRAIVTTDAPGCREVLVPEQSGWLVPVRSVDPLVDRIAQALADPAALVTMGQRGRAHAVATLSQDRVIEEMFEVFRRVGIPVPTGGATPSR